MSDTTTEEQQVSLTLPARTWGKVGAMLTYFAENALATENELQIVREFYQELFRHNRESS